MTDPARLCCVRLQRRRARSTTPPRVRAGRQRAQQPAARLRSLPPESAVRRAKGGGRGGGHAGRVGGGQDAARCNRQLKQRIAACESMPKLCSVIEQHAAELSKKDYPSLRAMGEAVDVDSAVYCWRRSVVSGACGLLLGWRARKPLSCTPRSSAALAPGHERRAPVPWHHLLALGPSLRPRLMQPSLVCSVSLLLLLVCVALRMKLRSLRALRYRTPRSCRIAVF